MTQEKKMIEIVVSSLLAILVIGFAIWLVILATKQPPATVTGSGLPTLPTAELSQLANGALIKLKKLSIFGSLPVEIAGAERSKENLFEREDSKENAIWKNEFVSVEYPPLWSKFTSEAGEVGFYSPLVEGKHFGSIILTLEDDQSSDSESFAAQIEAKAKEMLQGLPNLKISKFEKGIITYTYGQKITIVPPKDGSEPSPSRSGWIAVTAFESPDSENLETLAKLIDFHSQESKLLYETNKKIKDLSGKSRDEMLKQILATDDIITELNTQGENIEYHLKPYRKMLLSRFDADADHIDEVSGEAQSLSSNPTFTKSLTGDIFNR